MISEVEFIRDHTSFWRTISPLSEDFVRRINLKVLDRHQTPLKASASTSRRALINEIGFEIFSRSHVKDLTVDTVGAHEIDDVFNEMRLYITRLRNGAPCFQRSLDKNELEEAMTIARRLKDFFSRWGDAILRPEFRGSGKLDSCRGDIIVDSTLYEVKAGVRPFRSLDLRQLVLYYTLNHFSPRYKIQDVGLYNPRQGFHFRLPYSEFSTQFSGLSPGELSHKISYELAETDWNRFIYMG